MLLFRISIRPRSGFASVANELAKGPPVRVHVWIEMGRGISEDAPPAGAERLLSEHVAHLDSDAFCVVLRLWVPPEPELFRRGPRLVLERLRRATLLRAECTLQSIPSASSRAVSSVASTACS